MAAACLLPAVLAAVVRPAIAEESRPRVALVLSGGGARGLAHVGVLEMLERLRVPVDCVVGTSMGALVGGAYAAGVRPARMREMLASTDLEALFDDQPPRSQIPQRVKRDDYKPLFEFTIGFNDWQIQLPPGASAGYKFELFLKELIGPGAAVAGLDFDALSTPYRAVATDLESGKMRVFDRGDLSRVMRASMSLPAIIAPAKIDGRIYIDGGMVRNLPVDIGRALCGDVIIAVNVGTPLKDADDLRGVIDVARQSINMLTEQNVERSLADLNNHDIVIEPQLDGYSSSSFQFKTDIMARGVLATRAVQRELEALSLDEDAYHAWLAQREARHLPVPRITAIEVEPGVRFSELAIQRDLEVEVGDAFSVPDLHRDLARLYGRADFSYLGYSVERQSAGDAVRIEAEPKSWGPGYLKFGLNARSDFDSPTQSSLALSYRRTWANRLGAEWRMDAQVGYDSFFNAEFLQPLQIRDGAFIAPYMDIRRSSIQFYSDDLRLGQYRINSQRAGVDFGFTGKVGELRVGPYAAAIQGDPDFGVLTATLPAEELTQVGFNVSAVVDQLDSVMFPSAGWLGAFDVRATQEDWGSDDEYTRAKVVLRGVKSVRKNTLALRLEWGEDLEGQLAAHELFQLGGPLRLSGLFLDQLTGTRYNLGVANYYHRYADLPPQLGRGMYLGMSLEAGRIDDPLMETPWEWVTSGSIYWGADTVLGALYLGYGYSSLNQGVAYLMIGPQF